MADAPAPTLEEWQAITDAASDGPWKVQVTSPLATWETFDIERGDEEPYVAQDCDSEATARFIVTARAAMPLLVAAVRAALEHHVEAVIEDVPVPRFRYCSTCSGHPAWPCPEVEAITAALAGKEAGDG